MGKFAADITEFVRRTKISAEGVLRKFVLDLTSDVMQQSPVKTGRFRGNWRVGVDRANLQVDDGSSSRGTREKEPLRGGEIRRIEETALRLRFGQTAVISNNLPYAKPLNDGHSKQAPKRFVEQSFVRAKNDFSKTVSAVRRRR